MIYLLLEAQKGRQNHEETFGISEGFSSVSDSELTKNRRKQEITLDDINSQAFVFFFWQGLKRCPLSLLSHSTN